LLAATEISTALYNLVSKFEHLPVPAATMLAVLMDEYEKAGNVTIEIIRCVHVCFFFVLLVETGHSFLCLFLP
jgi:hypothetical protein